MQANDEIIYKSSSIGRFLLNGRGHKYSCQIIDKNQFYSTY